MVFACARVKVTMIGLHFDFCSQTLIKKALLTYSGQSELSTMVAISRRTYGWEGQVMIIGISPFLA